MKIKIIFCIVVFFLGIQNHTAQKKWSLDECIAYAFQNNLSFQNNKYDLEIKEASYNQSKRNLLPSISASSGYSINYGRSIDPNTNGYTNTSFFSNSYSVSASLDLFAGFRKWNAIFYEDYQKKATEQSVLKAKQALKIKILESFHEVLYSQELLNITKEQLDISKTNVKIIDTKISLGLKAKSDLHEANSLLLSDSLAVLKAQNSVRANKLTLLQVMNLPEKEISLQHPLELQKQQAVAIANSQFIIDQAVQHVPEIIEQEFLLSAAKKQVRITRSYLLPSISLRAGYSTGFYEARTNALGQTVSFTTQIQDNASKYIAASLNIPIFSGLQKRHQLKLSKIQLLKAENNLRQKKQLLAQEIEAAVQKANALSVERAMSEKSIDAKELAFTIAQKKFSNGLINFFELSQIKKEFIQAKVALLQVSIQLISNKWLLHYYQNNTLN
ncbi:transporter [Polaribacter pacificus]|uniref:Transporter n=1 Tax=Polaribacter pacificus TaxID=1775173 RepID=A0A917MD56_9FLAO|nr:TolC family protein [Polaribacter pacificus]GGG94069.1 transporter [Polaribacter pacificus]